MRLRMAWMVIPVIALSGCATGPATTTPATTATSTTATSIPPVATPTSPAATAPAGTTACKYVASGQAAKAVDPPSGTDVQTTGTVTFTMSLTAGDVVMTMDRANAPCAVNSFASLVSQSYFDNTDCHRLALNFVLQCGDPTGTGRGGPGYSFADELTGNETYPRGTVAMANAGPNTNGSQFFIVLADAGLPPSYDVLGQVSADSMQVVDAIAAKGLDPNSPISNGSDGRPLWGAHIDTVTAG